MIPWWVPILTFVAGDALGIIVSCIVFGGKQKESGSKYIR